LGRWLSLDPLMAEFPDLSPYNFCQNSPIYYIDPDGKKPRPTRRGRNSRSNNGPLFNKNIPRTSQTNSYRLEVQNRNSNNKSSVTRTRSPRSNSLNPLDYIPNLISNNQPHDQGQNSVGSSPDLLSAIIEIRDLCIKITDIYYHFTTVTNHSGLPTTTLHITLSDIEQQKKIDLMENNYQNGLQEAKNKYIKENKPVFDTEKYNNFKTEEEKQTYNDNFTKRTNKFNLNLAANLAGITIQYRLNKGKSPYELLKEKALDVKNQEGVKFNLYKKGEKTTETLIYPTQ